MELKGVGVSSTELEHFFNNNGRNLSDNFVGVFPADKKKEFLDEISGKETKYPFMIANTDPARKPGIHSWSFLDTDEKNTLFLFDGFGSYGLLNFIVNNDLDVFKCVIPWQVKQIFEKGNKITLLKWSFKLSNYKKFKQKQLNKLTPAARYFFKFLYDFGKYKTIKNTMKVVMVDNNLQSFDTEYCSPFQMCFYFSLFELLKSSVVAESSSKKLNVKLIGEMLNEIFNINARQNERILDAFMVTTSSLMGKMFSKVMMKWKKKKKNSKTVNLFYCK